MLCRVQYALPLSWAARRSSLSDDFFLDNPMLAKRLSFSPSSPLCHRGFEASSQGYMRHGLTVPKRPVPRSFLQARLATSSIQLNPTLVHILQSTREDKRMTAVRCTFIVYVRVAKKQTSWKLGGWDSRRWVFFCQDFLTFTTYMESLDKLICAKAITTLSKDPPRKLALEMPALCLRIPIEVCRDHHSYILLYLAPLLRMPPNAAWPALIPFSML